jgi:NhaP-type Na+/H+ or K+/H+ antiporter
MKSVSIEYTLKFGVIMRSALIAYSGAVGVVCVAAAVSISYGSGWRPALAGMPLYVILFAGITYQLIKEVVALKKQEREHQVSGNAQRE